MVVLTWNLMMSKSHCGVSQFNLIIIRFFIFIFFTILGNEELFSLYTSAEG